MEKNWVALAFVFVLWRGDAVKSMGRWLGSNAASHQRRGTANLSGRKDN